ncbi:MAG: magnesium transporter [Brevinemataceae bacterium]
MTKNNRKSAGLESNFSIVDKFEEVIRGQIAYAESLVAQRAWSKLRTFLHQSDPHEVASIIESLNKTDSIIAFRLLDENIAAAVFMNLDSEQQEKLLYAFSDSEAGSILTAMDPDDRTSLLGELPSTLVTKLLKLLPIQERKIANTLLNYPESSAGRIMTPQFVALSPDLTAMEALSLIKVQALQKETIYTCYVVDDAGTLIGSINLADVILAPEKQRIKEFMKEHPISASTHTSREEAARLIGYYDLISLPITDTYQRLVGIITHDDVLDIIHKETTEDFHRFTGINPAEISYLSGSLISLVLNRSVWVVLLLLLAGFSQDILLRYGEMMHKYWMELSLFFTVLVGVGGNIGSQSSILVIRGLATGELNDKNTWHLFMRALLSGLLMGILLALVLLLRIFIFHTGKDVQWVVTLSMVILVTVSNLLGALLPLFLKKINIDPAVVSAPLISTLMDLGGLIIYLEIARHFLY